MGAKLIEQILQIRQFCSYIYFDLCLRNGETVYIMLLYWLAQVC